MVEGRPGDMTHMDIGRRALSEFVSSLQESKLAQSLWVGRVDHSMFGQPPHHPRQHLQEGVLNEQDFPLQWHHVEFHLPLVSVGLNVE